MSFTYTNDPSGSNIDAVRFLINDKTESTAELSDEEIQYLIDGNSSLLHAAAAAAESVAAKYTNTDSTASAKWVGDLKVEYRSGSESVADEYTKLASSLRRRAAVGASAGIFAGGLSRAGKQANQRDTDRVQPSIERGMHDHEGTDGEVSVKGVMDW